MVESLGFSVESRLHDVAPLDGNSLNSQPSTFNHKDLTDRHVNSLYRAFSLDTGRRLRISDLYIIIESDFYPEYHPLRQYLQSLPAWDGSDYIDALASRVHVIGCSQEMHNRYFKKWIVAMVATWLVDDVTNHEILTYIGPQGIYKSTFMRQLLPPELRSYFSARNFAHRMNKDDRLELTEMGLIALEELDHMKDYELNQLKAITTDPTVNERAAYAHFRERRAHLASFCGTGNNPRFLTDLSGNRRWLPFMVESIDSPWERTTDYDGIYAQAYALWKQGFRYWFDDEENAELERHNRQFEEPNMEEELILTYLRQPYGDEAGEFLTATRIIELIGMYVKCPLSPKRVAFAMNRLGYRQRRVGGVRGYNVIILTGNDIKEQQRLNARESTINE
jgi:predicted P-loop ATPase